jgi:hypothetical protein
VPVKTLALSAIVAAAITAAAPAHEASDAHTGPAAQTQADHYAPYAFLIGEWDSQVSGLHGGATIRQLFRWGPDHTYIEASAYVHPHGQREQLHFEGIMTWNQARQNLDFLFMHEPGSGGQEAGIIRIREITETDGHGAIGRERQTWRRISDNTAETSMLHQNADGSWAPNFPGADHLAMTRRSE